MGRKKKEIKGLGDLVEKITKSTGIKTIVEKNYRNIRYRRLFKIS
jgi:hypothetical protein